MAQNFIGCDRDQPFLLPPDMREWLPRGHLAWFVRDAVAGMDLGEFHGAYRADRVGRRACDPAMMVALLLYAYARGVRSARFHRGGRAAVRTEWRLLMATHNLTKLYRHQTAAVAALQGDRIPSVGPPRLRIGGGYGSRSKLAPVAVGFGRTCWRRGRVGDARPSSRSRAERGGEAMVAARSPQRPRWLGWSGGGWQRLVLAYPAANTAGGCIPSAGCGRRWL
jgi:hypothetical protein